jgi:uncharacterized coiled-coil protein SlyX
MLPEYIQRKEPELKLIAARMALGSQVTKAVAGTSIPRTTWYNWQLQEPAYFQSLLAQARAEVTQELQAQLQEQLISRISGELTASKDLLDKLPALLAKLLKEAEFMDPDELLKVIDKASSWAKSGLLLERTDDVSQLGRPTSKANTAFIDLLQADKIELSDGTIITVDRPVPAETVIIEG